jgi:predicted site-specific integrase-resolvase
MEAAMSAKRLMKAREAAERIGVSSDTLAVWRKAGYGPPFVRVNAKVYLYDPDRLEAWIKAETAQPAWRSA